MVNLTHSADSYTPSPFMSFVGIEGSGSTHTGSKHQLWDWDTPNTLSSTPQNFPFYAAPPLLDGPPPSLFNSVPLPVYFPPLPQPMAIPEYHQRTSGFFKLEDGLSTGFGGQTSARIGLNLGHRTYFSSYDQLLLFGRSAHHQPPRCQAEGCMADLSGAKHYHRRHKVCDFHSKAAVVFFPGGVQQRFCQQCSRFHGLAEFDDAKRSCRKRLAEHNRRRRKAQPQPTIKGGSPSSLPPRINSKEEGKLISTSKGSMQLSGVGGSIMDKRASTIASMEEKISQYQQFHGHFASPTSSSNTFFQNHFNEGSNSTTGGSDMSQQNQNSILQLGQAMFEWDFI